MKRLILGILSLMLVLGLSGCSDEAKESPVKIEAKELTDPSYPGMVIPIVEITAIVDSITIKM